MVTWFRTAYLSAWYWLAGESHELLAGAICGMRLLILFGRDDVHQVSAGTQIGPQVTD
jgi:hypothetical protein